MTDFIGFEMTFCLLFVVVVLLGWPGLYPKHTRRRPEGKPEETRRRYGWTGCLGLLCYGVAMVVLDTKCWRISLEL